MVKTVDGAVRSMHGLSVEQLLAAVENELIPRLMVSHAEKLPADADAGDEPPASGPWASDEAVERFAARSMANEAHALREEVSALLARGVALEAVYLHLLAPAARRLGEQWTRDEISFVDVQLGLCCLHELVCHCGPIGFRRKAVGEPRSIVLGVPPGEQHTFGITLAADFFRRNGWQVSNLCGLDRDFIVERVAGVHYSAAGFSLYGEGCLQPLIETIAAVRAASCNPSLLVLVGGDFFARNPGMVAQVGADLSASDAHRAVLDAEQALQRRPAAPAG